MVGSLHSALHLVAWGNAWAAGSLADAERDALERSVGRFTEHVFPGASAPRTAGWFERLEAVGAVALQMPPTAGSPVAAAFAGGSPTEVIARTRAGALVTWRLEEALHPDRLRPGQDPPDPPPPTWRYVWHESPPEPGSLPAEPDVGAALGRLDAALDRAVAFTAAYGLEDPWGAIFRGARNVTGDPSLPAPYGPRARMLLGRARAAWVFGGMGSWNDLGFAGDMPETHEYVELTDELHGAVVSGAAAAVSAPHAG
jgi:hypothetical protein